MEGRSLSQLLTRSIECKRVVSASHGRDHNGVVAAVAPEPNVPMDLKDDDDSSVAPPNEYDDDTCTTVGSNAESHVSHNEEALVESNLLEVVTFPTAYTNSARHEVKLLKLLLDIGAPNYAFQSFIGMGSSVSNGRLPFSTPAPALRESNQQLDRTCWYERMSPYGCSSYP